MPLSLSRWNVLEKGRATGFRKGTLIGVSRALGWTDGSAEVVLQGGDPVIAAQRFAGLLINGSWVRAPPPEPTIAG